MVAVEPSQELSPVVDWPVRGEQRRRRLVGAYDHACRTVDENRRLGFLRATGREDPRIAEGVPARSRVARNAMAIWHDLVDDLPAIVSAVGCCASERPNRLGRRAGRGYSAQQSFGTVDTGDRRRVSGSGGQPGRDEVGKSDDLESYRERRRSRAVVSAPNGGGGLRHRPERHRRVLFWILPFL